MPSTICISVPDISHWCKGSSDLRFVSPASQTYSFIYLLLRTNHVDCVAVL